MKVYSLLSGGISGWWASIEDAMADATINTIIGISVVFLSLLFTFEMFITAMLGYFYVLGLGS